MASSHETDKSRSSTDHSLRQERERTDDELRGRSDALAEDADELIERAREHAKRVLELAHERADEQLSAAGTTTEAQEAVEQDRQTAAATLAAEHAAADTHRYDERERRRAALLALLAHERSATDTTLAVERGLADRSLSAREDLLGVVAHDLRNMLQLVMVHAANILVSSDLASTAPPAAAHIQRVGALMGKLVEDLLDFSSFAAGKLSIVAADVDLVQLVRDAVNIHTEVANANRLVLTVTADVSEVIVVGDGKRLTRVLMNLISNAIKFTPSGGSIDVRVSVVDRECEVAVTDNGVGIPDDQLDRIFGRFEHTSNDPRRVSGVGLGLYIARLITDAHGGRVWAESQRSRGSTFRMRLPIKQS